MQVKAIDTYSVLEIKCEECGAEWLFAEHQDLRFRDVYEMAYCPFCAYEDTEREEEMRGA